MNKPDKQQSVEFLRTLDPDAEYEDGFTFQTFDDNKDRKDPALAKIFHGTLDEHWETLCDLNRRGAGIHVTVNKTDLLGRKNENIIRIRALWQEDDDGFSGILPLKPHIVVETSEGKFHRYLLTDHDSIDDFNPVLDRMIRDYGSDPNAKGIARVLRIPGFFHQKDPGKPFRVQIVEISDHPRYSWDEIEKAFPPVQRDRQKRSSIGKDRSKKNASEGKAFPCAKIYAALHYLNPDCPYQDWLEVGMAIHNASGGSEEGFKLFELWSKGGLRGVRPEKFIPGEPEQKWRTFNEKGEITVATLFKKALNEGWEGNYLFRGSKEDAAMILREKQLYFNEFNALHGAALIQGCTVVVRNKPGELGGVERELVTVHHMRTYCENRTVPEIGRNGVAEVKLFHLWLESPKRREYLYGARFKPEKGVLADNSLKLPDPDKGYLELYTGLAIIPAEGECSLILAHINEIWCSGNDEAYQYIMNWLARIFQYPGEQGETAIVLRSGEGTGKNMIADILVDAFGPHGATFTKSGDITGRFTDHLATCVFVFLNEAVWGGDKLSEGTLKALITDKTIQYEKKYMPKFAVKNCLHLMMASNNDWVAPVGIDDRRYFYLDVSEARKNDQEYFGRLKEEIDNGGKEAFIWHLLNRDITGFNPRIMPKSQSETRRENKLRTRGSVALWWDDVLDSGCIDLEEKSIITYEEWEKNEVDFVAVADLHDHYLKWCNKHNERHREKKNTFGKILRELLSKAWEKRTDKCRGFQLPRLNKCRGQWTFKLKK